MKAATNATARTGQAITTPSREGTLFALRRGRGVLLALLGLTLAGCESTVTDTPVTLEEDLTFTLLSNGALGRDLGRSEDDRVRIQVSDAEGRPVPGVAVEFEVPPELGELTPATALSDSRGIAESRWRADARGRSQPIEAAAAEPTPTFRQWVISLFAATSLESESPVPSEIRLSPTSLTLEVGQSQTLSATVLDQYGVTITGVGIVWHVGDATVAEVSSSGLIRGVGAGDTQVGVHLSGNSNVHAVAAISVNEPESTTSRHTLTISPTSVTLDGVGTTAQLSAQLRNLLGWRVFGETVEWSSSNPAVATVSGTGLVTARAIGTALIIASTPCCGATDTITVEVRGDGPSVRIEAPKNLRITGSYEAWTVRWDALSGASYYRLRGTTPNGSEVIEEVTGTSSRSGNAPSGSSVCVAGVGSEGVGPESCIVFGGDTYESDPDVVEREPQQDSPLRTGPVGANEPSGFRAFTQRSFASRSENGWRFWEGNGGRFDILSDSGALHGSTVGRITFPAGMGSTKPAETLFTSLKTPELYLRFRIKVSSNWRGHVSGVNKVLYLTDATAGGSGDPGVFVLDGSGSSPLRPQIRLQNPTLTPGAVNYSQNVGNRPIERGRWHDVEILLRYNTAGSRSDGQAHVWVDGTKVIQYNNIRWASGGALSWDAVRWEPYWGGQGDTLDRTQYMYMDYIHVSGK